MSHCACTDSMKGQTEEVKKGLLERIPLEESEENQEPKPCKQPPSGFENIYLAKDSPNPQGPDPMDTMFEKIREKIVRKRALQTANPDSSNDTSSKVGLKSAKMKKVTLSDSVEIHGSPQDTEPSDDPPGAAEGKGPTDVGSRVRGRKRYQNTVKVSSAQNDCNQQ